MRNPNGYGTVVKLKGNRRKPFQVRKTTGFNEKGHPIYISLGFYETKEDGLIALAEYNKDPINLEGQKTTLEELFNSWVENKSHNLAHSTRMQYKSSFNNLASIKDMKYKDIKGPHMQGCIDNATPSMRGVIKNLLYNLDKYALELDIVTRTYSQHIIVKKDYEPKRERKPFTEYEIALLWDNINTDYVDVILIYIYTGFRLNELLSLKISDVDLDVGVLIGGLKTKAGKNRKVPIHSKILPLVQKHYNPNNDYLFNLIGSENVRLKETSFRTRYTNIMSALEMDHIIHETRHTFRTLLHNAEVDSLIIDMIMGHSRAGSTGDKVYTHKTIEQLKNAVEKILI